MNRLHKRVVPTLVLALLVVCLMLTAGRSMAADVTTLQAAADESESPAPWRGSLFLYRNVGSAISLDEGAELTYNPYYAMTFQFSPRWWFGRHFYLSADADITREITDADDSTRRGEWWWGDVRAGAGAVAPAIPWVGIVVSGKLDVITPTSKVAEARSTILALRPALTLSRTFPLLSGLTLAYSIQGTKYFNEYTTSQREVPIIPGCTGVGCGQFVNIGLRNPSWRLTNAASISMAFFDWLGISADAAVVTDTLYGMEQTDERVSFEPQEPTDERYVMAYSAELWGQPMDSLSLALGFSTVNPQLQPDSTYREPVINRYTTIYFDVRFHIDGFISQVRNAGGDE